MDHLGYHIKVRKDRWQDEGKVIVGSHEYLLAWVSCVIKTWCGISRPIWGTFCVKIPNAHLGPDKIGLVRAYSDIQIFDVALSAYRVPIRMKADDHAVGFINDGGKSCILDFLSFTHAAAGSAVAVQIHAAVQVVRAGRGIADAETGGVLNDQPGVEQAAKLQYPDDGQHQDRQDQRKLDHALRFPRPAFPIFLWRECIHTISFGQDHCEILVAIFLAILSKITVRASLFGA